MATDRQPIFFASLHMNSMYDSLLSPAQKWQWQLSHVRHQQLPNCTVFTRNVHCLTSYTEHANNTVCENECMHDDSMRRLCSACSMSKTASACNLATQHSLYTCKLSIRIYCTTEHIDESLHMCLESSFCQYGVCHVCMSSHTCKGVQTKKDGNISSKVIFQGSIPPIQADCPTIRRADQAPGVARPHICPPHHCNNSHSIYSKACV
jgi:hypothetical protein